MFYRYQVRVWNASGPSEDVELAASAWLPPRPFLDGDVVLSSTCTLTVDGSFQLDAGHGASFASASAMVTAAGAPVVEVTGGFSGVTVALSAPWLGPLDVTWSVTDSFGQQGITTDTVLVSQAADRRHFNLSAPVAMLGADTAAGHQLLVGVEDDESAPCASPCLGRRGSVAVGAGHSCVLDDEGGVLCAGDGAAGQLGRGDQLGAATFDSVCDLDGCAQPLKQVVLLQAGEAFTCGLTDAGDVLCWGDGSVGQLGGAASSAVPVLVTSGAASLAVGAAHACALLDGGGVTCWGSDDVGQLGRGALTAGGAPAAVCATGTDGTCVPLTGALGVAAGQSHVGGAGRSCGSRPEPAYPPH